MDRRRRKLLAASVGVAAVSYVVGAACNETLATPEIPAMRQMRQGATPPTDRVTRRPTELPALRPAG
jgi:hypothetical protein